MIKNLDDYQSKAIETSIYPNKYSFNGLVYCTLKLNGEAGEVAEKIGKIIRDNNSQITPEQHTAIVLELGDVLWYIANAAKELNVNLSEVAENNLNKLAARKARNTLRGSGDLR